MMGLFMILPLILIGAVALVLIGGLQFKQGRPLKTNQTAEEILKERYARGEISREEYDQTKLDLEGR